MNFANPPHVETILDLGFDPIPGFSHIAIGEFHASMQKQYGNVEEHPALPPFTMVPEMGFVVGPPITVNRVWHVSADLHSVLQIQQDRLIVNWRRNDETVWKDYPGYTELRRRLTEAAEALSTATQGDLQPRRIEFAYENAVSMGHVPTEKLDTVFTAISPALITPDPHVALQQVRLGSDFAVDVGGETVPCSLELRPELDRQTGEPFHRFRVTSALMLAGESLDRALQLMDCCHDAAIKVFGALTDDTYQREHWGRIDA